MFGQQLFIGRPRGLVEAARLGQRVGQEGQRRHAEQRVLFRQRAGEGIARVDLARLHGGDHVAGLDALGRVIAGLDDHLAAALGPHQLGEGGHALSGHGCGRVFGGHGEGGGGVRAMADECHGDARHQALGWVALHARLLVGRKSRGRTRKGGANARESARPICLQRTARARLSPCGLSRIRRTPGEKPALGPVFFEGRADQ